MGNKENQTAKILRLFKEKGTVTNAELNKICFRYGARIYDLRKEGHAIVTNHISDGLYEFAYFGHYDDAKNELPRAEKPKPARSKRKQLSLI